MSAMRVRGKSTTLAAALRQRIAEGHYKPGQMLPTQKDLARQFGLAGNTTWMAMERLAKEGLIRRVPGKGTFVNEVSACGRIIDFVRVVRPRDEPQDNSALYVADLFAHLCAERSHKAVWHHLLFSILAEPADILPDFRASQGVIARRTPDVFLYGLFRMGVPVVSLHPRNAQPTAARWPQVDVDRGAMVHLAVTHLLEQGRRRIMYTAHGPMEIARFFLYAARDFKLALPAQWILEGRGGAMHETFAELREIFQGADRPDAVCVGTCADAVEVERLLLDLGLRVPQDVAIVACGDHPGAESAPVPITTAAPDMHEMCARALALLETIEPDMDPQGPLLEVTLVPPRLKVRPSSGGGSA